MIYNCDSSKELDISAAFIIITANKAQSHILILFMRVVLFFDEFPNINLIVCYHFADIKLWKQTCQVFCKTIHVAVSVSEHSFSHTVTYFKRNFFLVLSKEPFSFLLFLSYTTFILSAFALIIPVFKVSLYLTITVLLIEQLP